MIGPAVNRSHDHCKASFAIAVLRGRARGALLQGQRVLVGHLALSSLPGSQPGGASALMP